MARIRQDEATASGCLLQECSENALLVLESADWTISRSIDTHTLDLSRSKKVNAAVAVKKAPNIQCRLLSPASFHAAGMLINHNKAGEVSYEALVSAYLPPGGPAAGRLDTIERTLRDLDDMIRALPPRTTLTIGGDFNLSYGEWAPDDDAELHTSCSEALMAWMTTHGAGLVTPPYTVTHHGTFNRGLGNTLDLTFSSQPTDAYHAVQNNRSDHYAIYFRLCKEEEGEEVPRHYELDRKKFPGVLRRLLAENDGWDRAAVSLDAAVKESRITKSDLAKRKRSERQKWPGWSTDCQMLKEKRDRAFAEATKELGSSPSMSRKARRAIAKQDPLYRRAKIEFEKALASARKEAAQDHIDQMACQEERTSLSMIQDKRRRAKWLSPPLLDANGREHEDIEEKLCLLIKASYPSAMTTTTRIDAAEQTRAATGLERVTREEIDAAVRHVASNKAAGPDGIEPSILKQAYHTCPAFQRALWQSVNECLVWNHFPTAWKTASISMISKTGRRDMRLPASYRPISLLCATSKIAEWIVCKRLQHELLKCGRSLISSAL